MRLIDRRRALMGQVQAVDPFSLYVTNGLVLWLDGIKNTASGHDASATYWEDLSGNGHDYGYNANNIIYDKYLDVNGAGGYLRNALTQSERSAIIAGTVEIVYDAANTGTNALMVLPLGNVKNTISRKNGSMLFRGSGSNLSIGILTGVHTYCSEMYRDGEAASNTNVSISWNNSAGDRLFMFWDGSYQFKGHVYALRVYDRILTESEIIQNFKVDKIRFEIS